MPHVRDDPAQAVADMALDMQAVAEAFSDRTGQFLRLRMASILARWSPSGGVFGF